MQDRISPKLTLIEAELAAKQLKELIQRAIAGEEIVLTIDGRPGAMLAPPETMNYMGTCGLIDYELPFDVGGYGWLGPESSEEARQEADQLYEQQLRDRA